MSAAFSNPSKVSFFIPASLFVFKSVTTNEIIFGCTSCTSSEVSYSLGSTSRISVLFCCSLLVFFELLLLSKRLAVKVPFAPVGLNWPTKMAAKVQAIFLPALRGDFDL